MKVERIEDLDGNTLALIVRDQDIGVGVDFITHPDDGLQVGFIKHPLGHTIEAHRHKLHDARQLTCTEVIEVRRGRMQVFFYPATPLQGGYSQARILGAGDLVVLLTGGHGFRMLEDTELIEVKQGPYRGHDDDKEKV